MSIQRFLVFMVFFIFLGFFSKAEAEENGLSWQNDPMEEQEYLPELSSPPEMSEEFNLSDIEFLENDKSIAPLGVEEWSDRNGVDLTQLFRVLVVVNKATRGPSAQTAKVYFEGRPYNTFTISTGRETLEKSPSGKVYHSVTPLGWYTPQRLNPNHFSKTWKAPMPWAVFFNGGIALHATTPNHYNELGQRASGGCVRFRHDEAKDVYHLIKNAGIAQVPAFTQEGELLKNADGQTVLYKNYDTLIIVEENNQI